jgi:hypothetical protein
MQSAQALREQAFKCLQLARYVKDRQVSEKLRSLATQYCERAVEIEASQDRSGVFRAGHFAKSLAPRT